jgi:hypothetical protein
VSGDQHVLATQDSHASAGSSGRAGGVGDALYTGERQLLVVVVTS